MAAPVAGMLLGMTRSQIKREMTNRACSAIAKQQVKAKTSKPITRNSYKVYKNIKNNQPYTAKDAYRDTKQMMKFIKILKSRSLLNVFSTTKSIVGDIQGRMKYAEYLKNIKDLQKKYNLNIFDKVIFDLSQKSDGMFSITDMKINSKEFFNKMFTDTKTAENFTNSFHEYIDFRIDNLERVGFLNKHVNADIFEVTDLFHDRLEALDLFNKDIPLEVDFNNYQLYIINEAIKSDGLNLNTVMEQFKNNPEIENPEERLKVFTNVCEKLTRYNYLEKLGSENDTIFKITEKGVSELYMYRDLDNLEKSIYTFLKENNGAFDKDAYIKYLQQDKKLFNSVQRLMPMEEKKEKKPFKFGKYDANYLFKEFFVNGVSSNDKIVDLVNEKFTDPGEANKNLETIIKRLEKNCENEYLSYDQENNTYTITPKGREAAESIGKEFIFTSYDVNVVFDYINRNNGSLSMQNLKDFLNDDLKNPKEIEKQLKYLQGRYENNVNHGYLEKDSTGNYKITEKGKEEENRFFGILDKKLDDKLSFLKNAHLIDEEHNIGQLFHDVHDRRLSHFDKLIHEISELNKGLFNVETLIDGATIHYMHNMGATKQTDDKIKEFEEYIKSRLTSLERIDFIKYDGMGYSHTTEKFNSAFLKQGESKEILNMPGAANELSTIFKYIDKNGTGLTMAELKEALKKEFFDLQELNKQYKYLDKLFTKSTDNGYLVKDKDDRYIITQKGREKESSCTKYHIYLLNQANSKDGFLLSNLLENYKNEGLADPEGKFKFTVMTLDRLTANKFLEYNTNGSYHITKQGVEEIYNRRNLNSYEKLILDNAKKNNGAIDIQELTKLITQDSKIVEQVKKDIPIANGEPKTFTFGKYDANVIFKQFDNKNKNLVLANGQLDYERENNIYAISQKGLGNTNNVDGNANVKVDENEEYSLIPKRLSQNEINDLLGIKDEENSLIPKSLSQNEIKDLLGIKDEEDSLIPKSLSQNEINALLGIQDISSLNMQDSIIVGDVIKDIPFNNGETQALVFDKSDTTVIINNSDNLGKSLTLDTLKADLMERFEDPKEASEQYNIMSKRIEKLAQNGYINYDPESNIYTINQKGLDQAKEVNKNFIFTSYDLNVVFKYIDDNGGRLSIVELEKALNMQYADRLYVDSQLKYLEKRFKNNVKAGYLQIDVNGVFSLSDKGIYEKNKELVYFDNFLIKKIETLENMGLLSNINETFFVTDFFNSIVDNKVNFMDKVLIEVAMNNDGIINFDTLKNDIQNLITGDSNVFMEYYDERKEALINAGYILFLNENNYEITEKFENVLFDKKDVLDREKDKYIALSDFKFSTFDQAIFNSAKNDIIDLNERKIFFQNRYMTRTKEAERQFTMLSGRCKKLCNAGYLEPCDNGFIVKKYPDKINSDTKVMMEKNNIVKENVLPKNPLETFKITKYDFDNITKFTYENIWDVEVFKFLNTKLDAAEKNTRASSVIKRLNTLNDMGLSTDLGNGKWQIDPMLIERSKLNPTELTREQKRIFEDMKDFLNFTETQISEFIYSGKKMIFHSDINNLVNRGLLKCESRDIYNSGIFEKIYYLSTDGKKEICKHFDVKIKDIHNSKIHRRPEELGHDILIYSAYIDAKEALEKDGFTVTKHMTDRQMKSYDMTTNNEQRNDYGDLYMEFEDIKTGEKGFINIEIDLGYAPKTISGKAQNIENLFWYTNSQSQADKITKYAKTANIKVLNF